MTKLKKHHWIQIASFIILYWWVLPLFPDKAIGPFQAINPHDISHLAFAIYVINTLGNMAVELSSGHHALLLTGFMGGFSSSTATIIAMGTLAKQNAEIARKAASAAIASNIATYIQMAVLIGLTSPATLMKLSMPILAGFLTVSIYCLLTHNSAHMTSNKKPAFKDPYDSLKRSLSIVAVLTAMLILIAGVQEQLGATGLYLASLLSGFVDGHASAISVSEMVSLGKLSTELACIPILLGLSSNTLVRCGVSLMSMNKQFASRVITGLFLSIAMAWLTLWLI